MDFNVFGKRQVVTNHVNGQGFRVYYQRMANEVSALCPIRLPPVDGYSLRGSAVSPGLFKRGHVAGRKATIVSSIVPVVPELRLGGPVKYVHLIVAAGSNVTMAIHARPYPAAIHTLPVPPGQGGRYTYMTFLGMVCTLGAKARFLREFPVSLHGRVDCQHRGASLRPRVADHNVRAIKDHIYE